MGSPVSPIVANLYMEQFEREEWSKFLRAPEVWFRYVDDATPSLSYTNIIWLTEFFGAFKLQGPRHIHFTGETESNGKLPFLDTCIVIMRMVQRRSPFTKSLLLPINIWILIPITIWNTNDRWWELSFFEPRRSSRTIRTRKLNWNILNQSFRTTATNRGCLESRQTQPTPQVQKAKSFPVVLTVSHFPTCKGCQETGSQTFSKNKELAHSASLSRPSGSIWSTPKIRHTGKEMWGGVRNSVWELWWFLS